MTEAVLEIRTWTDRWRPLSERPHVMVASVAVVTVTLAPHPDS